MVALTAVAAYLLLHTLWATQEMARDTRRIGEAQVRAYLTVTKAVVAPQPHDWGVEWTVRLTIRNSGQSPASHIFGNVSGPLIEEDEQLIYMDTIAAGDSQTGFFRISTVNERLVFLDTYQTQVPFSMLIKVSFRDVFCAQDETRSEAIDLDGVADILEGKETRLNVR